MRQWTGSIDFSVWYIVSVQKLFYFYYYGYDFFVIIRRLWDVCYSVGYSRRSQIFIRIVDCFVVCFIKILKDDFENKGVR